jgi:hypothetical protein
MSRLTMAYRCSTREPPKRIDFAGEWHLPSLGCAAPSRRCVCDYTTKLAAGHDSHPINMNSAARVPSTAARTAVSSATAVMSRQRGGLHSSSLMHWVSQPKPWPARAAVLPQLAARSRLRHHDAEGAGERPAHHSNTNNFTSERSTKSVSPRAPQPKQRNCSAASSTTNDGVCSM